MNRDELIRLIKAKKELQLRNARVDPNAFCQYVLRDEKTNTEIESQWFHKEWQETLTNYKYVVIHAPVEHGKTSQIAVGRSLFEIGRNPNIRGCIISETMSQAQKILGAIKKNITENEYLKEVFPHLKQGEKWRDDGIIVERDGLAKDYTLFCSGLGGAVNSARLDFVILDDCLDFENTRNEMVRAKALEWVDSTVIQRITDGGQLWAIGTPWHELDLYHELAKRETFTYKRYSAVHNPTEDNSQWKPIWPDKWPVRRLIERQKSVGKSNFARKLLTLIDKDDVSRFESLHISNAIDLGKNYKLVNQSTTTNNFTGVDLGAGKSANSGLTVLFTIAYENGTYRILEIQSGHWKAPEILSKLLDTQRRFNSIVNVESNATQVFIQQQAEYLSAIESKSGVFMKHFTGRNKLDPDFGVESISIDLSNGRWIIPESQHPEIKAFISEMIDYQSGEHTGDRLMACWMAREAARLYKPAQRTINTIRR